MRAVHTCEALLDTWTTHWYRTHFIHSGVWWCWKLGQRRGAHLERPAAHQKRPASYWEITETRKLEQKAKKRKKKQENFFKLGFRHGGAGDNIMWVGTLFPCVLSAPRGSAACGCPWGGLRSTGTPGGRWAATVGEGLRTAPPSPKQAEINRQRREVN